MMPNRIWRFKSVPHRVASTAIAHVWQWQTETPDGVLIASTEAFHTLIECVRDARRNGFTGELDPVTGVFTARDYEVHSGDYGAMTFIRPQ
jgi:hypothetical protein